MARPQSPPTPTTNTATAMARPQSPPTRMTNTATAMARPQSPPTPTTNWKNFLADDGFPDDLLVSILLRIPCRDDRDSMSLVCKAWRGRFHRLINSSLPPPPPLRPLPRLLLPSRFGNDSTRLVCLLSGCKVHEDHRIPTIIPRGARFFGSHEGAWLFLASREPHGHRLLHVNTGDVCDLPGKIVIPDDPQHPYPSKMFIQAAALNLSPYDENCIAVFVVRAAVPPHYRYIAMCGTGPEWPVAIEIQPPDGIIFPQDVIFHEDAFYLLHNDGDEISIFTPEPSENQEYQEWRNRRFHPGWRIDDEFVRSRYLVSSRGDLLLVVRLTPGPDEKTSSFKVFRAIQRPQHMPDHADFPVAEFPWAWSEVDNLDGRILFLGYGCSRSYDTDEYPGCIYFMDDEKPGDEFFRGNNTTPYPCSDNGRYCDGQVEDCFRITDLSEYSSPVWLLP